MHCTHVFRRTLGGKHVQLSARAEFGGQVYEELALCGVDGAGGAAFWSFTSDGKPSHGVAGRARRRWMPPCTAKRSPSGREFRWTRGTESTR